MAESLEIEEGIGESEGGTCWRIPGLTEEAIISRCGGDSVEGSMVYRSFGNLFTDS